LYDIPGAWIRDELAEISPGLGIGIFHRFCGSRCGVHINDLRKRGFCVGII
jgi:hypothetical protein